MNEAELTTLVIEKLCELAPEIEPATLVADRPLRRQVDLDSVDWLNFLIALHEATGVDIPESDYAELRTIDELVRYLARRG